jgi:hypothetical protein
MLARVFSVIVMCRMYVEAVSSAPGRRKRADMDLSVAFYGSFLAKAVNFLTPSRPPEIPNGGRRVHNIT